MSLNCCHVLHRTDSDQDLSKRLISHDDKPSTPKNISSLFSHKILAERNWSGKLMASPRDKKVKSMVGGATPKKFKAHHRRYGSTGALSYGEQGKQHASRSTLTNLLPQAAVAGQQDSRTSATHNTQSSPPRLLASQHSPLFRAIL
uniref:Uncharacterized protein n=1 Tax=Chenopodium quinoa TaxID=63459 RepID=A0A803LU20_CHEQI